MSVLSFKWGFLGIKLTVLMSRDGETPNIEDQITGKLNVYSLYNSLFFIFRYFPITS